MNTKIKKLLAVSVASTVIASTVLAAGCSKKRTGSDVIDSNYEWLDAKYTDTSELSDYSGQNKLDLVLWRAGGLGNYKTYKSSNNLILPEIERVTGVTLSDKSFDNGGFTADVKYTQLLLTGDCPDIVTSWANPEACYDLTDLIDKYCPTIKSRMPASVWKSQSITGGEEGKVYAIPFGLGNVSLEQVDKEAIGKQTIMFSYQNEYYPYVVVRDDILKEAYPNAKTQDEIDALYKKQGYFTEDDLFDVEITSAEQFRTEFLPKIQNVIDNNDDYKINAQRRVGTMLITEGSDNDNWSFLGVTLPKLLGATATHQNCYFSYWDTTSQKVELMLTQNFYKNEFYEWAKMINDGKIVSKEGMATLHDTIASWMNSGYYAIGYQSSMLPSGNTATFTNAAGETKTVKYRKVYLKIERDKSHFEFMTTGVPVCTGISILKGGSVRESDLPQVLRWLDYQCSRLADKLYAWGPRSAGLFTEETDPETGETIRQYKDPELVQQMVFSTAVMGNLVQKYSLANGTAECASIIFPFYFQGGSIHHPKCIYNLSELEGLAASYFTSAAVCQDKAKEIVGLATQARIDAWKDTMLDGVEAIWAKRKLIEDQLKTILLSGSSRSNFDREYENLQKILNENGWTKSYFNGKFTNAFLKLNSDYLDLFYKG